MTDGTRAGYMNEERNDARHKHEGTEKTEKQKRNGMGNAGGQTTAICKKYF